MTLAHSRLADAALSGAGSSVTSRDVIVEFLSLSRVLNPRAHKLYLLLEPPLDPPSDTRPQPNCQTQINYPGNFGCYIAPQSCLHAYQQPCTNFNSTNFSPKVLPTLHTLLVRLQISFFIFKISKLSTLLTFLQILLTKFGYYLKKCFGYST